MEGRQLLTLDEAAVMERVGMIGASIRKGRNGG
jgi:hypothetical protein